MNIFNIIENFADKDALAAKSSRRNAFKQLGGISKDIAKVAVPFGLVAGSAKSSFAAAMQTSTPSAVEVLNFALFLEYLERDFYQMGMDTSGLIPQEDRTTYSQILQHEADHVDFLVTGIEGAGGTPIDRPEFDFTAGGMFDPFNNYDQYITLTQGFEDTGVRAYKGQAGNLMDNKDLLTAALQIHSVEARHASQIRRMRDQKGWIIQSNYDSAFPAAAGDLIYGGETPESNLTQGGVDLTGMFGEFGGDDAITEAYDEPLTMAEVQEIAGLFVASNEEEDDY